MKKVLLLCIWIGGFQQLSAQLGINIGSQFLDAPAWERVFQQNYNRPNATIFQATNAMGIDLRLASKKVGYAFSPQLSYSRYRQQISYDQEFQTNGSEETFTIRALDSYQLKFLSLSLSSDFYLLNLKNPIQYRSINEGKDWLKRGLFLRIAPGLSRVSTTNGSGDFFNSFNSVGVLSQASFFSNNSTTVASILIGLGLDIKISHFLNISPLISIRRFNTVIWRGFGENQSSVFFVGTPSSPFRSNPSSIIYQTFAGVRMGIQFAKKRKRKNVIAE